MDFKLELKKYQELINEELTKHLRKEAVPESILNHSVEYSLMAGGKRLRPILMLKTYQLFNENIENCMPFAIAMEMIHNFSLIHDDLPGIDNDDFRHGKLTNHKKFNEATAILAGDSLLNQAYIVISKSLLQEQQLERKIRALSEFTHSVDRMIAGEYVDTEYEGKQISHEYLEYIHNNKTGALLKACCRIGAILAGAQEEDIENITEYANYIGLAFQIKDDILSEIGDEKVLGKPTGNDKEKGKCTYVTKYGLEESQKKLEVLTKEAIKRTEKYGEKGEFLKELALYMMGRNK